MTINNPAIIVSACALAVSILRLRFSLRNSSFQRDMELIQKLQTLKGLLYEMNMALFEAMNYFTKEASNQIEISKLIEPDKFLKIMMRFSRVCRSISAIHDSVGEIENIPKISLKYKLLHYERLKVYFELSKNLLERLKQSTAAKDFDGIEIAIDLLESYFIVNKPNDSKVVQE
jgi:hypothetical protein